MTFHHAEMVMRKPFLVALCLLVCACRPPEAVVDDIDEGPTAHVPVELTAVQEEGRVIYETMCWSCHGQAGRGDGPAVSAGALNRPPPSFQSDAYANVETEQLERRFQTTVGDVDPNHPHMQYVASLLEPEKFAAALAFLPALSYPAEIPGSALAGEDIYGFRCVGCHGPFGRGDGTAAASLVRMSPADFTQDTLIASENWDGLFQRVSQGGHSVLGSSMPPWGQVLSEPEIWDLVAYLATFQPGRLAPPSWAN